MIVVKLGGSLAQAQHLRGCLDSIATNFPSHAVVVVPGGGDFAEQVRLSQQIWHFSETAAHAMALLAMQQMALLCHDLKPEFALAGSLASLRQANPSPRTLIWSPDVAELDRAGIPASWDITSDSLAAWLANTLTAEALVLVKSITVDAKLSWRELAVRGVVDKAFPGFAAVAAYPIHIISAAQFQCAAF